MHFFLNLCSAQECICDSTEQCDPYCPCDTNCPEDVLAALPFLTNTQKTLPYNVKCDTRGWIKKSNKYESQQTEEGRCFIVTQEITEGNSFSQKRSSAFNLDNFTQVGFDSIIKPLEYPRTDQTQDDYFPNQPMLFQVKFNGTEDNNYFIMPIHSAIGTTFRNVFFPVAVKGNITGTFFYTQDVIDEMDQNVSEALNYKPQIAGQAVEYTCNIEEPSTLITYRTYTFNSVNQENLGDASTSSATVMQYSRYAVQQSTALLEPSKSAGYLFGSPIYCEIAGQKQVFSHSSIPFMFGTKTIVMANSSSFDFPEAFYIANGGFSGGDLRIYLENQPNISASYSQANYVFYYKKYGSILAPIYGIVNVSAKYYEGTSEHIRVSTDFIEIDDNDQIYKEPDQDLYKITFGDVFKFLFNNNSTINEASIVIIVIIFWVCIWAYFGFGME